MKKGQILEGIVTRVDFPNQGIVKVRVENGEEALCLVKNVLPGQRVSFRVQKKRNGRVQGQLLEVLEKAGNEVESPCPHFGVCGGCLYHTLSYEDQCALKEAQVKKLLEPMLSAWSHTEGICRCGGAQTGQRSGGDIPLLFDCRQGGWEFETLRPSPAVYGYRNKMEFTFGDEVKDGPLSVGLHKRGGFYDIVTVSGCLIMDEDYRKILTAVREYFEKTGLPFFHRLRHTGFLRHLLVRKGAKTGEILVALVTTSGIDSVAEKTEKADSEKNAATLKQEGADSGEGAVILKEERTDLREDTAAWKTEDVSESIDGFAEMLLGLPLDGKIVGILHMRNDSVADVVKSDETRMLYGRDYFYEELLGLRFRITAFSFFQTNSLGAEALYSTVREFIGDFSGGEEKEGAGTEEKEAVKRDKVVFDLYSGTGTIAQLMAPAAKKVVGVEIVEEAVGAAKENAALNGLYNCEFIAGDVLKVLDELEEKPDFIILDPPREGVHPKALKKILDYGVERIVYISCKPTSLARDLESFLEAGYQVERAVCCDQFPWTGNIETICCLSRIK